MDVMLNINLIQPTTWERNLAGICYNPYWIYVALKEKDKQYPVKLYENVTMREVDDIFNNNSDEDLFVIDLTSYPQIELCKSIYRDYRYKFNIKFIGYTPLIKSLNLPLITYEELNINILDGVFNYIFYDTEFKYMLLNDCDNHIKNKDPRRVVPLFLSIGCKRNCPFCYVSAFEYPYGQASFDQIKKMIDYCVEKNYNIHFSDENFYYHKEIDNILKYLEDKNIKWICLTDSLMLTKMIEKYGDEYLLKTGNFLNEIGLETADEENLDKKQNLDVIFKSKLRIFWLVVTFMPNETIKTLNTTGMFHLKHGYNKNEVLRRVVTNSTVGGLGQFFQPYHNTEYWKEIEKLGKMYASYPTRLWPSFVGNKFLNDVPIINKQITDEDIEWFDLYSTKEKVFELINKIDGKKTIKLITNEDIEEIVIIAQLAKLNVIRSVYDI